MEIDVRQRNQRSIKRRERAQRMQAERESMSATAALNGNTSLSDVVVASAVLVAANAANTSGGDSADEDELPLLKVVGGSGAVNAALNRHKKSSASTNESSSIAAPAAAATMKEEVPVDWLKMEPRLGPVDQEDQDRDTEMMDLDNGSKADGEDGVEPLLEEDVIDGFAILAFRTYEDLEVSWDV